MTSHDCSNALLSNFHLRTSKMEITVVMTTVMVTFCDLLHDFSNLLLFPISNHPKRNEIQWLVTSKKISNHARRRKNKEIKHWFYTFCCYQASLTTNENHVRVGEPISHCFWCAHIRVEICTKDIVWSLGIQLWIWQTSVFSFSAPTRSHPR